MGRKTESRSRPNSEPLDFEEIEHTADWALRITGSNLEELLCNAARGMNSLMVREVGADGSLLEKPVELEAIDAESLLVEWLSELAYWAEREMLVFERFAFHALTPTHLKATLYGRAVSAMEKHIKAVTYHNLKIAPTARGLEATVVFDV
ncbi:MAG: archease [Desulfobacterales bacterium]|nr:MAG: archease [Desulfobacterales bacterium]